MLEKKSTKNDLFQRALGFYTRQKIDNAVRCCHKSISENPNHFESYNLLGVIAKEQGKNGDALNLFKKAIGINGNYAEGYNNLGVVYNVNEMRKEAILCFQKAVAISPSYAHALYNLACSLEKDGQIEAAIAYFKQTVKFAPGYSKAYNNLGNIYYNHKGDLDAAAANYLTASSCKNISEPGKLYINLASVLLYKEGVAKWRETLLSTLTQPGLSAAEKADLKNSIIIANWLSGYGACDRAAIEEVKQLAEPFPDYPNFKDINSYNGFLRELFLWYENNPEQVIATGKKLYFIGDSHSLTLANKNITIGKELYKCDVGFIKGCKIWDLVKDGDNKFKYAFEREINSLPDGAKLVLSIGEIDCRYDVGLFMRHKKYETDLHTETNFLLDGYFAKLNEIKKRKNITIILSGIPAPHSDMVNKKIHHSHKDKFVGFIRYFNEQLRLRTKKSNITLADNYLLTANIGGVADNSNHLDWYHIKPDIFRQAITNN